jgi:hypothetical protein
MQRSLETKFMKSTTATKDQLLQLDAEIKDSMKAK